MLNSFNAACHFVRMTGYNESGKELVLVYYQPQKDVILISCWSPPLPLILSNLSKSDTISLLITRQYCFFDSHQSINHQSYLPISCPYKINLKCGMGKIFMDCTEPFIISLSFLYLTLIRLT